MCVSNVFIHFLTKFCVFKQIIIFTRNEFSSYEFLVFEIYFNHALIEQSDALNSKTNADGFTLRDWAYLI